MKMVDIDKISNFATRFIIILTVLFLVVPIVLAASVAFDSRTYAMSFPPIGFTLKWFERVFNVPLFRNGLITSVVLALSTTVFSVLIGIPTCIFIVRHKFKGKGLVQTFLLSPLMVPGVVIGNALVTTFYQYLRWYNSFPNLLIAHIVITLPYSLRIISASLIGFDRSLEEAAQSLGASEIQAYFKVTIPLIKASIIASAIFTFIISWSNVNVSAFLTDAYTITFPVALFSYMRVSFDPSIAASSVMLVFFTLVLIALLEKLVGIEKFIGTMF